LKNVTARLAHGSVFANVRFSLLLIGLLGLVAYSNSLRNEFVWDDVSSVQFNKHITSPSYIPTIFKSEFHHFGRGQGNFYRPFLTLSFMMDYAVWKLDPKGYHFTNMLMHIGVAMLVFAVMKGVFQKVSVALASALLFVVHPIHTQAVTYVSGRGDMLTNLFLLLSFLLYWLVSAGTDDKAAGERRVRDIACIIGSILCYVAALLSKETAIILPFIVLAGTLIFKERRNRNVWILLGGLFAVMVVYAILRLTILKFGVAQPTPPLAERLGPACQAFVTYIRLLLVPVGLHMERTIDGVSRLAVIFTIACLVGSCVLIAKQRRDRPGTVFALSWFLIAWIPISGIYPLNAAIAEHWIYLPSIGLFALVVATFERMITGQQGPFSSKHIRTLAVGIFALILICFTGLTMRRNTDWRTNQTLYESTLKYAPNSSRVHYNLGVVYEDQGNKEGALKEFLETLRLDPNNAYVRLDIAAIYAEAGDVPRAAGYYIEAIKLSPDDPEIVEAYMNLGMMYQRSGHTGQAVQLWRKALELRPDLDVIRGWIAQAQRQGTNQ